MEDAAVLTTKTPEATQQTIGNHPNYASHTNFNIFNCTPFLILDSMALIINFVLFESLRYYNELVTGFAF